jgi:hypothetical protein
VESDPTYRVGSIGPIAARTIARARRGRVAAVFARSAYLDFGDLVCLGLPGIGNGALNVIVERAHDLQPFRLAAGVAVECDARVLRIDDIVLDGSAAPVWRPLPLALPIDRTRLARGIAIGRASMTERAPADGLAFLVTDAKSSASLAATAWPVVDAFSTWLSAGGEPRAVPAALAALIGLGPGLTPSGDDFLGGALIALRAFGQPAVAEILASWLRPLLDRTHPVSAAHLAAACEGVGSEALHACIHAMASSEDPRAAIDRVAAIGHTSGWDALAGALLVGDALTQPSANVAEPDEPQAPRSTRSASSAACALDGATITPTPSSVRACRE